MTRTTSIDVSADVMPVTSDSSALAAIGCVNCHAPPSFFSVVTSPAAVETLSSSILSACSAAKTFSCFFVPLSFSGVFHVTK